MDPILAIGIIGGGLIALKIAGNKDEDSGSAPETGDTAGTGANPQFPSAPNVGANASTIGYRLLSKEEYDKNGVKQGEYYVVRDGNGNITGTIVGTEGGQVFQEGNGDIHLRSAGDEEIEIEDQPKTKPDVMTGPPILSINEKRKMAESRDHRGAGPGAVPASAVSILAPSVAGATTTSNTPKLNPPVKAAIKPPKYSMTKPKSPVSSKILEDRIRRAAKAGMRIPM